MTLYLISSIKLVLTCYNIPHCEQVKDAPSTDIRRYIQEIEAGLYPGEVKSPSSADSPTLPWIFSPAAKDPSASMNLVEELQCEINKPFKLADFMSVAHPIHPCLITSKLS
jgi:hypothetical protein